jgi:hypothetical protein
MYSLTDLGCIFLPGFASIYFLLSTIYDSSNAKNILGVIVIITFLLNFYVLRMRPIKYDGQIVVITDETENVLLCWKLTRIPMIFSHQIQSYLK